MTCHQNYMDFDLEPVSVGLAQSCVEGDMNTQAPVYKLEPAEPHSQVDTILSLRQISLIWVLQGLKFIGIYCWKDSRIVIHAT